jgi:tetratricopeptide (TPR) repeat protein
MNGFWKIIRNKKDSLPDSKEHRLSHQNSKGWAFPVVFSFNLGINHRKNFLFTLALALVALAGWFAIMQIRQDAGLRVMVSIVNQMPEKEQLKSIACSRIPLVVSQEKAALEEAVLLMTRPAERATAFCLLGDYPSAILAYNQAASNGDSWSALQVYFIQARQGNMQAANQVLSGLQFSKDQLNSFFSSIVFLKLNVDVLPLARRMAELYPEDSASWQLWLSAAREFERNLNWSGALDAYLEAIQTLEKAGLRIGLSSFEMGAGRIYQVRLNPRDPSTALTNYNRAISGMDFLETSEASTVFVYRGDVYQSLKPSYTVSQALQEYLHALNLDPKNILALRAIALVYLGDLQNYPLAETYINQAISFEPDSPENYQVRGDIYRKQGRLEAAASAYEDALARRPGWQSALNRLAAVQAELKKKSP